MTIHAKADLARPLRVRHPEWFGVHPAVLRMVAIAGQRRRFKLSIRDRERIRAIGFFRVNAKMKRRR